MAFRRIWHLGQLFRNLLKISRNPQETSAGLAVADHLYCLGLLDQEIDKIREDSENRRVLSERKLLGVVDLKKLQELPPMTLGRNYADHMIKNNLDPDFYGLVPIVNDTTFVMMRMRQTHDLWHILTGFNTKVTGELGLQSFMMAQNHSLLGALLIGGQLLKATLKNPAEVFEIMSEVSRGWQMGVQARSIFSLDWTSHWTSPLERLRDLYQIRVPTEPPFQPIDRSSKLLNLDKFGELERRF